MTPHSKKTLTIYDIARNLELSPGTISKILHHTGSISDETRKRVLDYIAEVGFVPSASARILKAKRSWTIGVVFADISQVGFEHPFFAPILQAFKNAVEKEGYELVFITKRIGDKELSYLEWCQNKQVDGIYIVSGNFNNPDIVGLADSNYPCVSSDILREGVYSIISDDHLGITLGYNHLKEQGYHCIAAFSGPLTSRAYFERYKTYQALEQRSVPTNNDNCFYVTPGYGYQNAYEHALLWIAKWTKQPEAVLAFSDDLAMGLIDALATKGLCVPEDIEVIGYDDTGYAARFKPALTTIRQHRNELGEVAARTLIDLMQGKEAGDIPVVRRLPVELVIRQSTKR